MRAPIPTLSTKGWITDIPEACDVLLSHFYCSYDAQTQLYFGNIASFQSILKETSQSQTLQESKIEGELHKYLNRYFDLATIRVTVEPMSDRPEDSTKMRIRTDIKITDGGRTYSLGNEVLTRKGMLHKVSDLINMGVM